MIQITERTKGAVDSSTLLSLNTIKPNSILSSGNILALNSAQSQTITPRTTASAVPNQPVVTTTEQVIPSLTNPMQKGQKALLSTSPLSNIKVCLGWNVHNAQCDLDVSAFLLTANGKVPGDDWFVFYGQEDSPDHSTKFQTLSNAKDREMIQIDFNKLDPSVNKIVFVLTINEAFEQHLNFSMVKDAYIRILNSENQQELVSYKMTDYYSNVISMMIGELYQYNGNWKFNAVGNGVAKDLAGLCELYGVQVM